MLGAKSAMLPLNSRLHLCDDQLEMVDAHSYLSLIGKLLYVTDIKPYLCSTVGRLNQLI